MKAIETRDGGASAPGARFESIELQPESGRARVAPGVLGELCRGHFADQPIVPGAALIGLMMDLATCWAVSLAAGGARTLDRCRFRRTVGPDDQVELHCRRRAPDAVEVEARVGGEWAARARVGLVAATTTVGAAGAQAGEVGR